MPASPRGCYSQCSSEQHKSSDSGLSSPRPGHSVVFLPLCDGTHSCSFPSSERTMHVAITTWPPIKRVLRLSAAPNLAWCDRHGPPRWSPPGRRGTLGLSPHSFSVLSFTWRRKDRQHQRHRQCQRAVGVLLGFSSSVSNAARVTADVAGQQHALPQQPGPGCSQPAAAFATLVAGRRCLAAICRRDDAQQAHLAGKRQPTRARHSNSNHFSVCSFWDALHGLGRGSVYTRTFCPQPALQPRGTVRSVCRQDPAPLL